MAFIGSNFFCRQCFVLLVTHYVLSISDSNLIFVTVFLTCGKNCFLSLLTQINLRGNLGKPTYLQYSVIKYCKQRFSAQSTNNDARDKVRMCSLVCTCTNLSYKKGKNRNHYFPNTVPCLCLAKLVLLSFC